MAANCSYCGVGERNRVKRKLRGRSVDIRAGMAE